ncbi:hypothetical protein [Kitasatospora brasiliensis]|uniref:hypothetical protein n=1 Tax=Kitasatospora brasiliensis TaxID=3058040 RepID=UPI00292DE36E|nr:hypothetical protein [Kitasatospora sp. K002]
MPSLLHYEILTDPTSLQASADGAPSVGTVYVVVSNTHQAEVEWQKIDIEIPVGPNTDDLTNDTSAITASISMTYSMPWLDEPVFAWDATDEVFRAQHPKWPGQKLYLPAREALVLKLENIPITRGAGLVLLKIHDITGGGDGPISMLAGPYTTTLAVTKQTSKAPRNFHPTETLVNGSRQLKLEWNGPDNLSYWIRYPDNTLELAASPAPGPAVTDQPYSWPVPTPTRGTTYTLIAGTNINGQPEYGYFLTTTVHALIPEFADGTRTPWIEGTTNTSLITFTPDGIRVDDRNHAPGTVEAQTADVHLVKTETVHGRDADSGWIDFPADGIHVHRDGSPVLGVVTADRADVTGVNTTWVGTRAAGQGWIDFSQAGATLHKDGNATLGVFTADGVDTTWVGDRSGSKGWLEFPGSGINVRKDGGQAWGIVAADKADLNGINTKWVQGRSTSDGWIEFPTDGVRVYRDGGHDLGTLTADKASLNGLNTKWVGDRDGSKGWLEFPDSGINVRKDGGQAWGIVAADKADLNGINTKWVQGRSTSDGWIEFPTDGLRVYRDGGHDLGTLTADKASLNEMHTVESRVSGEEHVRGLLTVGGGMKLSHDGQRMFITMPDRIIFSGINEFKKWVTFEKGIAVTFGNGGLSMTHENGIIAAGANVQIQQGKLSISTGNPPRVREL